MNNSRYNLRDKWQQRDRPEVLWVIFESFLYKGLILATLCGKEVSLMEILKILAMVVHGVFEPFWRKLPARLSTQVALLLLNFFNIFRIDTELTFSNLIFFFHGS